MNRTTKAVAAVALLALVALAGCNGAANGGGSAKPYDTPLNGSQVDQQHASVLDSAGSFTVRTTTHVTRGSKNTSSSLTAEVDANTGAYLINTSVSSLGSRTAVYRSANGTQYARVDANGKTRYATGSLNVRYNASDFTSAGLASTTERANFSYEGTRTVNGTTLHEYVAHPASLSANASASAVGNVSASANVTVRLGVRSDGLVQVTRYSVNTSTGSMTATRRYSHLGSTDPTPSWLADAKANATAL